MKKDKSRRLIVFNSVTLDGYFTGADGDMSWAHSGDAEWNAFIAGNAKGECVMVFGRHTYEIMASWWPTPTALKSMPLVAQRMNEAPKVVFSKTLKQAFWNNTKLVKRDLVGAIRKLKTEAGPDLIIFGSGTVVAQLAQKGLIDEYQIALIPLVLGSGRTMFDGMKKQRNLKLTKSRTFTNGNVFLCYEPIA